MVDSRRAFWFGTIAHSEWIATPLQGADSTPSAWGVDGTLLNGGGYGFHSWDSHKRYTYEWPQSSSPETAQKMKSYRDGTYGRGLLYFLEPGIYRTNIFPARWADPSMAIDNEAVSLKYGVEPEGVVTSGASTWDLPVMSAVYELNDANDPAPTQLDQGSAVFLPVPQGHEIALGAIYSSTGSGGVYIRRVALNGTVGARELLTPLTPTTADLVVDVVDSVRGVWVEIGRGSSDPETITLTAMTARIMEAGKPAPTSARWIGGQGHSGCRFLGTPSYVYNSPIEGGRVGFAASFIETGSWARA